MESGEVNGRDRDRRTGRDNDDDRPVRKNIITRHGRVVTVEVQSHRLQETEGHPAEEIIVEGSKERDIKTFIMKLNFLN
jgi:hypothetical protein